MGAHKRELVEEAERLGLQDIEKMDVDELQDAVDKANDVKMGQSPKHPPGASSA